MLQQAMTGKTTVQVFTENVSTLSVMRGIGLLTSVSVLLVPAVCDTFLPRRVTVLQFKRGVV